MDCSGIAGAVERKSAWLRKSSEEIAVPQVEAEVEVGGKDYTKVVELQSKERAE